MNKKLFLLSIPTLLSPYIAIFTLAVVFLSTKVKLFEAIMESIFQNNGLLLIAALVIYFLLTFALCIATFFISTFKFRDAISMAKTAMLIKLMQIPAYVVIFVLGLGAMLGIMTIPFAIALFWIDCLCLFLTGLPVLSSIICALRQGTIKFRDVIWVIILQFVFCADVVAAIIYYKRLKEATLNADQMLADQ
jgi:hypothetical protein